MTVSKARTFRNVMYAAFSKGITFLCAALTTMVVARNLTASDYGVVGFATIIIGFLLQFADLGLLRAAIRRPNLDIASLQTVFTLKAILSLVAFLAALALAPFSRHLLDHSATGGVISILALDFLVSTIGFGSRVELTREMSYRALTIPAAAGAVVQCVAATVLVLLGWSYWAVVIAEVLGNLASGLALQFTRPFPIRFHIDWPDAQKYLRFGIPLFGSGFVIFILTNLDNFLVSTSMGSVQLGYYALAFTWATFICMLLNATVNDVLLPTLATIQDDPVALRRWYLKTIDLTGFVGVAANTALLANAHWFLVTFLGKGTEKWLPAETALQVLCIYGILRTITEPISPCLMARGDTRTLWNTNLMIGAVEVVLLLLALRTRRIEMVGAAMLAAYSCAALGLLPFLRRELSITLGDIAAQVWPIVPALVVGYTATSVLPVSFGNSMLTLAARGLFTASVAAVTHGLCTHFRCFQETGGMISHNLARIRARA